MPHLLAFKVKEYDPAGNVVAEIRTDLPELGGREAENWPFTAIRMENGHTLVNLTHGNKTAIFDAAGKVVWKVDNGDLEGRFADPCGGQLLPNGHVVITSYAQRDPSKVRVFEVNPQKEVVWELFHPKAYAHGIHVVSTQGRPLGASLHEVKGVGETLSHRLEHKVAPGLRCQILLVRLRFDLPGAGRFF